MSRTPTIAVVDTEQDEQFEIRGRDQAMRRARDSVDEQEDPAITASVARLSLGLAE